MANIIRFTKTGDGRYTGTCGSMSVTVERSGRGWDWTLLPDTSLDGRIHARHGRVRSGSPEEAQRESVDKALSMLSDLLETGEDDDGTMLSDTDAAALSDAYRILEDCSCETAS